MISWPAAPGQRLTPTNQPGRKTVLERAVEAFERGDLAKTAATDLVERQGFSDVVPRFHTVNRDPIPLRFYEATSTGLVLTDDLLATVAGSSQEALRAEAASRWDLLEAAFAMHLPVEVLGTDEHLLYRSSGYKRIKITGTHPVLNGYQNGLCFYWDEPLAKELVQSDQGILDSMLCSLSLRAVSPRLLGYLSSTLYIVQGITRPGSRATTAMRISKALATAHLCLG